MDYKARAMTEHARHHGKLTTALKVELNGLDDLSTYYSPGVAEPCLAIATDPSQARELTRTRNLVAVISDGSAVLGLGNIGGLAGLPVMEGKSMLFKHFADIDSVPIVLDTQDPQEIIQTIKNIAPSFGGINLEDIKAPQCFIIEETLKKELNIPVFHDDQHGTAIVALAGLINSLKLTNKKKEDITVVLSGAGAAGIAIIKLLELYGVHHIIALDSRGAIYADRGDLNEYKSAIAHLNRDNKQGNFSEVIAGADVFMGLSQPDIMTQNDVRSMADQPVIFAMSNPDPEIRPDLAKQAGAYIMATGRSDYPNQLNNVLAFPGLFRGVLDAGITQITDDHKLAAAQALADFVAEPTPERIIPGALEPGVADAVAQAVIKVG